MEIDGFEFCDYTANRFTRNMHNYFDRSYFDDKFGPGYHDDISYSDDSAYLHHFYQEVLNINVSEFHTYGIDWRPQKVTFYIDGKQVGPAITTHIPTRPMNLILNQALPAWDNYHVNDGYPGSDISFPSDFVIDYVRVYKDLRRDFVWDWTNYGDSRLDMWSLHPTDRFVTGEMDGDGRDELIGFSDTRYCHVMDFDGSAWRTQWFNSGNGSIGTWSMTSTDRFVTGDLDNDGKDELIGFSDAGACQVVRFTVYPGRPFGTIKGTVPLIYGGWRQLIVLYPGIWIKMGKMS